ncbi:MAG: MEDS domain-containing protein [Flavobacterium sp.]
MKKEINNTVHEELRNSGIEIMGHRAWGTHFCNFYESKQDLLDILVPYYKAGLENNEFCFWVTSEPITPEDALHAMQKVIPEINQYIKNKNIEIIPYNQWYLTNGKFNDEIVLKKLLEKVKTVLKLGFDGMRVHGNESWLTPEIWKNFIEYERKLNNTLVDNRILVLCTYPLAKCDATAVLDVAHVHDCAVAKRSGTWEIVEAPKVKVTKEQVKAENFHLEKLVKERTSQLDILNTELKKEISQHKKTVKVLKKAEENYREIFDKASDAIFVNELGTGMIIDVNKKACIITGYTKEEFINGHPSDFSSSEGGFTLAEANSKIKQVATEGDQNFEWQFRYKDGSIHWIEVSLTIAKIAGVKRILSFFHEIDDRKAAEQILAKERREKQRQITEAVITAEESERQDIGRELHDNIQQILTTSRLYLDLAKKKETTNANTYIEEAQGMITKAINELRSLSHSMIFPFQDGQNLTEAFHHLANTISNTTGLIIEIDIENIHDDKFPDNLKLAIYRIVQEQFTNVIKHANAKKVILKMHSNGEEITLSIKDDGVGFDTSKKTKGFGLINLRTRASLCNGKMQIISSVGKGCELLIVFNCSF